MTFKLQADWKPAGDQPKAIARLNEGIEAGFDMQTLLGVTGSGKTFSIANVIEQQQRPTLVIAHNKTLAAQLCHEFRQFFPNNAVEYFVSYYDYYQPEAYMPRTDTYIEKESQINDEIDRLRHAATQALLTRRDVIIVASVSCIYNLGSSKEYEQQVWHIQKGDVIDRQALVRRLVGMFYERTNADVDRGKFRARGDVVEVMPISENAFMYRFVFEQGVLKQIFALDPVTRRMKDELEDVWLFPGKHYVVPEAQMKRALREIEDELNARLKEFDAQGKVLEAERLKRRTRYDIQMIKNVGFCSGIENYSSIFEGRKPGEPPHTLLSYFPDDFLTVIDESHVTIPQIRGMYFGDKSRKETLVEHGFRLPSAVDNRPLQFHEFEEAIGQVIFVSATPGEYEHKNSSQIVEQIVRPTGLVDPEIIVRPVTEGEKAEGEDEPSKGQVDDLMERIPKIVDRGERVLVTTLTKKMAEDLSEYLDELGVSAQYLHSDIDTLERVEILTSLRKGEIDVLVGVNLLREGLDLPEVSLVAILDADKEGFLRSETSLIQTIGRAARHERGQVILYADKMTGSLERAIEETQRRREIQIAFNEKHDITPQSVKKQIGDIREMLGEKPKEEDVRDILQIELTAEPDEIAEVIKEKRREMKQAAANELFETAALLRDEIAVLEEELKVKKKQKK